MLTGCGLIRFRDANSIRRFRRSKEDYATDWMMAFESVALDQRHFTDIHDALPGQAIIIRQGHEPLSVQVQAQIRFASGMFKYDFCA